LPGILRNSREKEFKKNPHRDELHEKDVNLSGKGLKKIRDRDEFIRHRGDLHGKELNLHIKRL
jgi:hypothetical protein